MSTTLPSSSSAIDGLDTESTPQNGSQTNGDLPPATETLMIDNFDSFTWNLYQSLSLLGADVRVVRNDAIRVEDFPNLNIKNLIISPGPGHPRTDSGISNDAIKYFTGKVPILGVCMGLECVVDSLGGEIAYAGEIMHGKTSRVKHDGRGIFKGVSQEILSTRYHSLSAAIKTLPDELSITSISAESGVIMGVRHRKYTVEAVQYHPESIMSEGGDAILKNFLAINGGTWKENPNFNVTGEDTLASTPSAKKTPTILEKIYAQRIKDVEISRSVPGTTESDLKTLLSLHVSPPLIPLVQRLKQRAPALMAEIKRASPSKGDIALTTNAAQQALTYALGGASVISVLTEPKWFKGSLLDMRMARQAIDALPNRPAILRKDFILDEYQILEARLHGADTVLLIVAMLSAERLRELYSYSVSLGMEPLVEVNNASEMARALELGSKVIGVNNRNLHDFNVDMGTTSRLADMCKEKDVILCALSGISGPEDVRGYVKEGVGAVLVGEALMRASDPTAFIRHLLDLDSPPPPPSDSKTLVKICGIRSVEHAQVAVEAGTDFIGLVFAPHSKRFIEPSSAKLISRHVRGIHATPSLPVQPQDPHGNLPWFEDTAERLRKARIVAGRPLLVGVFQGQTLDQILDIVASVQLDLVQLHGDEPGHWAKIIPVPVIRAFHLPAADSPAKAAATADAPNGTLSSPAVKGSTPVAQEEELPTSITEMTRPNLHKAILLDAVRLGSKLSGGAGLAVDWELAARLVRIGEVRHAGNKEAHPLPLILAGGLTPDTVAKAVGIVKPWAVDVSGGVETDGVKDVKKIQAFISAAKSVSVA